MSTANQETYSSDVRIFLEIPGRNLRVAQVGDTSLILKEFCSAIAPTTAARIVIVVNGEQRAYPITVQGVFDNKLVTFTNEMTRKTPEPPGVPF